MKQKIKTYFSLLRETGNEFLLDNATKLSASLAYYTIFAIGPLLLLVISLAGIFYNPQAISGEIQEQIATLVGADGAKTIQEILTNVSASQNKKFFGIISALILAFGATGVFVEIQTSINYIWSIRAKPKRSWLKFITDRFLSFSLIVGIGFLLIVSLVVNALMDSLASRLSYFLGDANLILAQVLSYVILFAVISFMFGVIYKVLPDARIAWKDAMVGATFTGFLFLVGKFAIGFYLANSNFDTYGAAASIIIVLSWVYYSAMILYFGAEFTKVYALERGKGIMPYKTAVFIVKREAKELPAHMKDPINNPANPESHHKH
ncbi:MAG: YihY/virulence factor BrkB family protein [Flavipsychrobacter sp.]|nr:YihY/virulence factor BrkB family protein [Flavipsychrobacter sp.]